MGRFVKAGWTKVTFSEAEYRVIRGISKLNRQLAKKKGRKPRYGAPADEVGARTVDLEGMLGEAAVAKAFDLFWLGTPGERAEFDVGALQVRATEVCPNGSLILHRDDHDDHAFVLAILNLPDVYLAGWAFAGDVKLDRFWPGKVPDRPCFMVPQSELRPMAELRLNYRRPTGIRAA